MKNYKTITVKAIDVLFLHSKYAAFVLLLLLLTSCESVLTLNAYCPYSIPEDAYTEMRKKVPVLYFPLETIRSDAQYPGGVYKYCNHPRAVECAMRNRNPYTLAVIKYDRILVANDIGEKNTANAEHHGFCHVYEVTYLGVSYEDTNKHLGWRTVESTFLRFE